MVNSFIRNLSQVFVCVLFVLLVLVEGFKISELANEQCEKCKEENRELGLLFDRAQTGNPRKACVYVQHYLRCAEELETKCRQDIHFQAGLTFMRFNKKKFHCDSMNITWNEALSVINHVRQSQGLNTNPEKQCVRPKFKSVYKVCGLFGDPHLRTFSDKRTTCSAPGAWPLFGNQHLTVQVTNIPLENSSRATATSKVTVIVRGSKHKCIEEKTYQARSFFLPTVFSDGTKNSSNKDCPTRVIPRRKGRRVVIDICPLKTKIIIRQVGKFLTVHMRVPKDMTRRKSFGLCQHGCPRIELMNVDKKSRIDNVIASFYKQNKLSRRVKRQRQERAKKLCGAAKVTGFYYKSCLFDMLTSDDASFVKAARKAMKDFKSINRDDQGRPIVDDIEGNLVTTPTTHQTSFRTTDMATSHVASSSTFTVYKSSLSLMLLMVATIQYVLR